MILLDLLFGLLRVGVKSAKLFYDHQEVEPDVATLVNLGVFTFGYLPDNLIAVLQNGVRVESAALPHEPSQDAAS